MTKSFSEYMAECPLVAILRGIAPAEIPGVCNALYEAGIRLLEIPLNTVDAFTAIELAVKESGDRFGVGAGTVLTPEDCDRVKECGGRFIISPNSDAAVIRHTKELGLISIPGFFTATEGFAAIQAGADYLKLFPAALGPGYVKDLKAVIKKPILAVGGVNKSNAADFMQVCAGLGIGSALYKPGKSVAEIGRDAAEFVRLVRTGAK